MCSVPDSRKTASVPSEKSTASGSFGPSVHVSSAIFAGSPPYRYIRPSRVIPQRRTSYASLSMFAYAPVAEDRETSYSEDFPPKRMRMVFFMLDAFRDEAIMHIKVRPDQPPVWARTKTPFSK